MLEMRPLTQAELPDDAHRSMESTRELIDEITPKVARLNNRIIDHERFHVVVEPRVSDSESPIMSIRIAPRNTQPE